MTRQGATRAGEGAFRESKREMCTNPKRNYKEEIIKAPQDFSEISSSHDLSFPFLLLLHFLLLLFLLPFLPILLGPLPPIALAGDQPRSGHVTKLQPMRWEGRSAEMLL